MMASASLLNITRSALLAVCALSAGALAQTFPSKPVRILVPFPAGSGVDIIARMIGNPLAEAWGQAVVVDNRPGASGAIACELAAKAVPDGYTLLLGNASSLAMAPSLYARVAYDPIKSFAPITVISTSANVLVVHPSVPVATISALIALAKTTRNSIKFMQHSMQIWFSKTIYSDYCTDVNKKS